MFSRNYYTDKYEPKIAEEINELAPDYFFVGISSPRKERFILKYKHSINVGVFYGVGGAFDAKAGVLITTCRINCIIYKVYGNGHLEDFGVFLRSTLLIPRAVPSPHQPDGHRNRPAGLSADLMQVSS